MLKQIQNTIQKQSLVMTSSMHQSLAILQMSSLELADFITKEQDKNLFLEEKTIVIVEGDNSYNSKKDKFLKTSSRSGDYHDFSSQDLINNMAEEKSLKDHVAEQINLTISNHQESMIAYYLLDYLQPTGYLGISVEEVSENLKCDIEIVQNVLNILYEFDPVGIFSVNLKECLAIQVKQKYKLEGQGNCSSLQSRDSLLNLIDNIELVASCDYKELSKICRVTVEKLGLMIKEIKSFNPKPGNSFFSERVGYKIPDVVLEFDHSEKIKLDINENSLPNVKLNQEYYEAIKDKFQQKEDKEFVKKEFETASYLIKNIEHRTNTVMLVAKAIVEQQYDFFTKGVMHLKPLTLSQIAQITGFNESTISRSTSNKYISTPSGIFELKYFFSSGVSSTKSALSEDNSSTKVKEIIKQLILLEDPENILSDEEIVSELKKFNIKIARRTVAKYREFLSIATSSIRKRQKMMNRLL